MSTRYNSAVGDVENEPFMTSDQEVSGSGARKTVKWIAGSALLAGCLVAAMAYRTPAAFGLGPHGLPASKFEGIVGLSGEELQPYELKKGVCSKDSFTGGGMPCKAPWVYCTDANCDQKPVESSWTPGLMVAKCYCWMPNNTMESIIPRSNAGAGCVADKVSPGKAAFGFTGGKEMCQAMKKKEALVSTYGPTGKSDIGININAKAVECPARTKWAWCWGAPCKKDKWGRVICECPITVSDWDQTQYVSVSDVACDVEKAMCQDGSKNDPGSCSVIHNGSPAGESPMSKLKKCE